MWLDRFSAQSTPSATPPPQGRSYSPAPRRPYLTPGPGPLPPRPGLNPRSSSLSLVSPTSSTASLPTASRVPNGAGRRRQGNGVPPANIPDPLKVLETILGGPPRKNVSGQEGVTKGVPAARPVELVGDIDFRGLSLQAFAEADSDATQRVSRVHTYSAQSVEECTFIPSTHPFILIYHRWERKG